MAKFFIEYFLLIVIVLTVFTQIILPSIIPGLHFWWLFKSSDSPDIQDRISEVKQHAKQVRDEAAADFNKAADIKKQSDEI